MYDRDSDLEVNLTGIHDFNNGATWQLKCKPRNFVKGALMHLTQPHMHECSGSSFENIGFQMEHHYFYYC